MLMGLIAQDEGAPLWGAVCDPLGAFTQGRSKADAMGMLANCIEGKIDQRGLSVHVSELGPIGRQSYAVRVDANRPELLFAEILKYQRDRHRLSRARVASRFGCTEAEYAAIEEGRVAPSMDDLDELLAAAAPDLELRLGTRADLLSLYASASSPSVRGRRDPRTLRASRSDLRAR